MSLSLLIAKCDLLIDSKRFFSRYMIDQDSNEKARLVQRAFFTT
jgi:hypothetical protein